MNRVLADAIEDGNAILSAEESHHLVRVLRTRPGERFLAHDGKGGVFLCRLAGQPKRWYGEIIERVAEQVESGLSISLAQSLIKKDRFEWVIQKAVELGVREIVPVISQRTEIRIRGSDDLAHKMRRWEKILVEAFKQSGRSTLPRLNVPVQLESLLDSWSADLRFVLDEQGGMNLRGLLEGNRGIQSCQLIVGPEGGWDKRDRELFAARSITAVHLGNRILRTETCPIAVISILQYELGDMG